MLQQVAPTWVDFDRQLVSSKRGDWITYHRGSLMFDKLVKDPKRLTPLAAVVWKAYEDGKVLLVQRKHGPSEFEYIAIKIKE